MSFEVIFARVKKFTDIKNTVQLASVVGCSAANISKMKKKGSFPEEWSIRIGRKYKLLAEWILTGEGPKSLDELKPKDDIEFLNDLKEWIKDKEQKQPGYISWFEIEFKNRFPEFEGINEEIKKII